MNGSEVVRHIHATFVGEHCSLSRLAVGPSDELFGAFSVWYDAFRREQAKKDRWVAALLPERIDRPDFVRVLDDMFDRTEAAGGVAWRGVCLRQSSREKLRPPSIATIDLTDEDPVVKQEPTYPDTLPNTTTTNINNNNMNNMLSHDIGHVNSTVSNPTSGHAGSNVPVKHASSVASIATLIHPNDEDDFMPTSDNLDFPPAKSLPSTLPLYSGHSVEHSAIPNNILSTLANDPKAQVPDVSKIIPKNLNTSKHLNNINHQNNFLNVQQKNFASNEFSTLAPNVTSQPIMVERRSTSGQIIPFWNTLQQQTADSINTITGMEILIVLGRHSFHNVPRASNFSDGHFAPQICRDVKFVGQGASSLVPSNPSTSLSLLSIYFPGSASKAKRNSPKLLSVTSTMNWMNGQQQAIIQRISPSKTRTKPVERKNRFIGFIILLVMDVDKELLNSNNRPPCPEWTSGEEDFLKRLMAMYQKKTGYRLNWNQVARNFPLIYPISRDDPELGTISQNPAFSVGEIGTSLFVSCPPRSPSDCKKKFDEIGSSAPRVETPCPTIEQSSERWSIREEAFLIHNVQNELVRKVKNTNKIKCPSTLTKLWSNIATGFGGSRSAEEMRMYYMQNLSTMSRKGDDERPWTDIELRTLNMAVARFSQPWYAARMLHPEDPKTTPSPCWTLIATMIPRRSAAQCRNAWCELVNQAWMEICKQKTQPTPISSNPTIDASALNSVPSSQASSAQPTAPLAQSLSMQPTSNLTSMTQSSSTQPKSRFQLRERPTPTKSVSKSKEKEAGSDDDTVSEFDFSDGSEISWPDYPTTPNESVNDQSPAKTKSKKGKSDAVPSTDQSIKFNIEKIVEKLANATPPPGPTPQSSPDRYQATEALLQLNREKSSNFFSLLFQQIPTMIPFTQSETLAPPMCCPKCHQKISPDEKAHFKSVCWKVKQNGHKKRRRRV